MKCSNCGITLSFSNSCSECGLSFSNVDWALDSEENFSHHVSAFRNVHHGVSATQSVKPFTWLAPSLLKITDARDDVLRSSALPWNRVSLKEMLLLTSGFLFMFYLLATKSMLGDDSVVLDLFHNTNLVFHEAGHWIFALSGNIMIAVFGGSLNQILIPLIVTGAFWMDRDTAGFAFGLFWCFENFLDVAFYIADARALALPLLGELGKDGHDWHILLRHFGLLDQDILIAENVHLIGWFGMIAACAWFLSRWWVDNARKKAL